MVLLEFQSENLIWVVFGVCSNVFNCLEGGGLECPKW